MKQEIVCPCPTGNVVLHTDSIPFTEIPHQSKLFTDYQSNPTRLKRYYPLAVESHTDISKRIPEILENYHADRNALCDVLEEANLANGAGAKTLENIALLRDDDCVAVVSGQQAGLFTGPLYTIYKALSAVKMSECLKGRGIKAVPVFWIATEDHDFEEVSKIEVVGFDGELKSIKNEPERCYENLPVGYIQLDESIKSSIDELFNSLPHTEYSDGLREVINGKWVSGVDFGDAFARLLTEFLGKFGLIVLCPLDVRLKKLATPIYVDAIKKSEDIVLALRDKSKELEKDGYHAQVLVAEDYFPLFWQAKDRTRHALKKSENGTFKTKDIEREFTLAELAEIASDQPERFSPSVVLRSVVQDYLLPTVCYFGGSAEIAYFAQSAEVYRILNRPVTPILHRQSFTIIESKHAKTLQKYDLAFTDLFEGSEALKPRIVEKFLNKEMARIFAEAESNIDKELSRLDEGLRILEPTLADSLANRRKKIIYHISNIRSKFHKAQMKKDEVIHRRIEAAFTSLFPKNGLQERTLNVNALINRHGDYFIDWIYEAIDLDDKGHRLIYL